MSVSAQQPKKRPTPKPTVVVTQPKTPVEKTTETQDGEKPLTNADIIRMAKAGFGENVILNAIQTNESRFDVSMNALFGLKDAGVSQKIIETMQFVTAGRRSTSTVSEQVTTTPSKNSTSDNPLSKQSETSDISVTDIGVILIDGSRRVEMKRSVSDMKVDAKNVMIPIFGKAKIKSALNGNQAQLRISDTTPEFEVKLMSGFSASDQLVLIKVNPKSDRREIEIARTGGLGGSSGFRKEVIVPTTFEEIKTQTVTGGVRLTHYRVKVINPLPPGEYVFVPQIQTYYDFGVDSNAQNVNSTSQQNLQKSPSTLNSIDSTTNNKVSTNTISDESETPEITINTDIDKLKAAIVQRFTRENYDLDKDQPSQLVFSKNVGGAGGFLAGVLGGKEQSDARQVITFVMTKLENKILLMAKAQILYPNNAGKRRNVDGKKIRQYLSKELLEIKKESEK